MTKIWILINYFVQTLIRQLLIPSISMRVQFVLCASAASEQNCMWSKKGWLFASCVRSIRMLKRTERMQQKAWNAWQRKWWEIVQKNLSLWHWVLLDDRNFLGKVLRVDNGLYRIGTKVGIVRKMLSRNCTEESYLPFNDTIPSKTLLLRQIASRLSKYGGQGVKWCMCQKSCQSRRCACRKAKRACGSKYHPTRNCSNKG